MYGGLSSDTLQLSHESHVVLTRFEHSRSSRRSEGGCSSGGVWRRLSHGCWRRGGSEALSEDVAEDAGPSCAMDWWSLGVLLYELLFACNPFSGDSSEERRMSQSAGELAFPADVAVRHLLLVLSSLPAVQLLLVCSHLCLSRGCR